ncbi:YihA family ribosome biogenesis GTP-binding protein [bacterium]|nr:YihA family ribosome biogenesis GTP-binding protein [candidate division CSSED10-310 bacterium]
MKIKQAGFVLSAAAPESCPVDRRPEIAIAGRSNVGKSSLVNFLLNRKTLAKTSSVPGKTRLINFYLVNGDFYLVDLPGYGYTRAPSQISASWRRTVSRYFETRTNLLGLMHLIDIRHDPSAMDVRVSDWLAESGMPFLTILVKSDKLSRSRQIQQKKRIQKVLCLPSDHSFVLTSTVEKTGRRDVLGWIGELLDTEQQFSHGAG